jgi:hypothetical protein
VARRGRLESAILWCRSRAKGGVPRLTSPHYATRNGKPTATTNLSLFREAALSPAQTGGFPGFFVCINGPRGPAQTGQNKSASRAWGDFRVSLFAQTGREVLHKRAKIRARIVRWRYWSHAFGSTAHTTVTMSGKRGPKKGSGGAPSLLQKQA